MAVNAVNSNHIIARHEPDALKGSARVSANKYISLHNLPHWHIEHEMIYADSGSAEVLAGDTVYSISDGEIIFVCSGEVHYISAEKDSVISVIKLSPELTDEVFPNIIPSRRLSGENCKFKAAFEEISEEMSIGREYSEIIADTVIIRLLAEIFRDGKGCSYMGAAIGGGSKYKKLLSLISDKYSYITFSEAAEFMCFSKQYFSEYFQRLSGMTFTHYLNIVRVGHALELLSSTDKSVTEIARSTGFGTIRSFNRVFRELTGYTPSRVPEDYIFIPSAIQ